MAALSLFVGLMVPAELRRRAADAIAEGGVLLGGLFFLMTPSPVARLGLLHFSLLHPALASVRARVRVSPNPDPDSSPHPHLSPFTLALTLALTLTLTLTLTLILTLTLTRCAHSRRCRVRRRASRLT